MATPTAQEQYMLELVNRARANPNAEAQRQGIDLNQGLANGTLNSSAKQALVFNFDLIDSSRSHSQWMLDQDQFSHTGAGGSSAGDRMRQANYDFTGNWTWGENIAYQGSTGNINPTTTIAAEHDGLFKSSGHRTNILSDNFREIGIGAIEGEFTSNSGRTFNALMTTQNFAKSGNDVFLTGVAFDDAVTDDDFYTVGEGLGGINITATDSNGQTFSTTTYGSGGYQLALEAGTYEIDFSGGNLGQTVERTVTVGDRNVKLDLATDLLPDPSQAAPAAPAPPISASQPEPITATPTTPPPEAVAAPTPTAAPTPEPNPTPMEPAPTQPTPTQPISAPTPTPESPPAPTATPVPPQIVEQPAPATPEPSTAPSSNLIEGTANRDRLRGTADADEIRGGAGRDRLSGRGGNDTLLGADTTTGGIGEIDILRGGAGSDLFVLGDANQAYYNDGQAGTWGTSDFAFIRDFNVSQGDMLQLNGEAGDYRLQSMGSCGDALFHGDNELIAIVKTQGNEALALDSSAVQFI